MQCLSLELLEPVERASMCVETSLSYYMGIVVLISGVLWSFLGHSPYSGSSSL